MEAFKFILMTLMILLFVISFFYNRKPWAIKVKYFAIGMLVMYIITDVLEGYMKALLEMSNQ